MKYFVAGFWTVVLSMLIYPALSLTYHNWAVLLTLVVDVFLYYGFIYLWDAVKKATL